MKFAQIRSMKPGVPVSVQRTCRRKDGESRTMELLLTRFGCPGRELIVASFRDLTERKQAEAALRQSEDTLRLAIDTIPGLVWTSLPDGNIEYLNKRWLDYTGLRQEEAAGWGWQVAIHPEDVLGLVDYWKAILASGEPGEHEARLRRFDGEYRWFLFRGVPLYDEHGRVVKWYGTNTDIEALRASEHLARGQLEALTQTLNALAQESAPEKFLEHVLRTISARLGAHSISVWEMNERTGCVELVGQCEDNELTLITDQEASSRVMSAPYEHPVWREFFRTGRHCVIGEITSGETRVRVASGPDTPWHHWMEHAVANSNVTVMMKRLSALGVVTTLCVPMFVGGKVTGFLGIRFPQKRDFRDEEIELTRALAHQATLALQSVRLTHLSREAAVTAERNRMARDIHDTLAQGFTGVIVQLEAAEDAQANGLSAEAARHLERASGLARESLREARRSVHALRPQVLAGKNLCAAMEELIRKMTAGTSLDADFAVQGEPHVIPEDWEENLLRVGQEALTNTLRHARAKHFEARLTFGPHAVRLELRDDGCGFDSSSREDGLGLLGIRERVEAMSGELTIRSAPEKGATILVVLPLTEYSTVS